MGKRERYEPGTFCWVDLQTSDREGAKAFYGELFGWEAEDMPAGDAGTYTMLRLDGDEVCGLYEMEPEQGIPPHWLSYVSVEDADATASRASELGGTAFGGAFDVDDAGRMAFVQDPTGAMLGAWQPRRHIGARRVNDPGCLGWNELQSREPQAAASFYTGLFGWETETIEENGEPVYVTIKNGGSEGAGSRRRGVRRTARPRGGQDRGSGRSPGRGVRALRGRDGRLRIERRGPLPRHAVWVRV
jgi:predicted enzyme related to lactoylglutathione lyase